MKRSQAQNTNVMTLITVALTLLAILLASRYRSKQVHREITEGHTCVHFLTETGQPQNPAVLTIVNGRPLLTDLVTNTTFEPLNSKTIMMTSPVYRGRSLEEVLQSRPLFDFRRRRIFEQRAKNGWAMARERCQRHWTELTGT